MLRLAMHVLLPFAEQGVSEAQHRIAIMLQNGLGMVRNEAQAYKWMEEGAKQGHALAQHGLGFMYMEGDCVAKNSEKSSLLVHPGRKPGHGRFQNDAGNDV